MKAEKIIAICDRCGASLTRDTICTVDITTRENISIPWVQYPAGGVHRNRVFDHLDYCRSCFGIKVGAFRSMCREMEPHVIVKKKELDDLIGKSATLSDQLKSTERILIKKEAQLHELLEERRMDELDKKLDDILSEDVPYDAHKAAVDVTIPKDTEDDGPIIHRCPCSSGSSDGKECCCD